MFIIYKKKSTWLKAVSFVLREHFFAMLPVRESQWRAQRGPYTPSFHWLKNTTTTYEYLFSNSIIKLTSLSAKLQGQLWFIEQKIKRKKKNTIWLWSVVLGSLHTVPMEIRGHATLDVGNLETNNIRATKLQTIVKRMEFRHLYGYVSLK